MTTTDSFLETAVKYLGFPALKFSSINNPFSEGNNPDGFDCAGFIQYLLIINKFDLYLPGLGMEMRFAREFFDYFGKYFPFGEHKKGDLVFFSYCGAMPTHIALYIGDNKIIHKGFIDTSLIPMESTGNYKKRIIISDLDVSSRDKRNAGNPIKYNNKRGEQRYYTNPIGFKRFLNE